MDEEERTAHQALEDTVTVYRGVTPYNAKNIRALSWTLDRKTADRFAHRFGEEGTVYEAQIRKEHILALFTGRSESEVIVDPQHLEQIVESPAPTIRYADELLIPRRNMNEKENSDHSGVCGSGRCRCCGLSPFFRKNAFWS